MKQSLEALRREIGISKIDLLGLLDLSESMGDSLFAPDWYLKPDDLGRVGDISRAALEIASMRMLYGATLKSDIAEQFEFPAFRDEKGNAVSTVQASRALGIGEFNITNLVRRGKLDAEDFGDRPGFRRAALDSLVDRPIMGAELNSPLAAGFLVWLERSRRVAVPLT
jgi:hypothetical protein